MNAVQADQGQGAFPPNPCSRGDGRLRYGWSRPVPRSVGCCVTPASRADGAHAYESTRARTGAQRPLLVTRGQLWEHRASRRWRQWASSGPAVRVPDLVTAKQRAALAALRDAQHANDGQPVGTVAVARWCPEPWTCRAQLVAATLLALEAQGLAVCVSELGGRTWRLTEAGRRQLVPRRGPAPARGRRITAR